MSSIISNAFLPTQCTVSTKLRKLSQSAQAGGYWLITGDITNESTGKTTGKSTSNTINPCYAPSAFYVLNHDLKNTKSSGHLLSVFDYQYPTLQLLSLQPLAQHLIDSDAVEVLSSTHAKINPPTDQACLFLGSELGIGPLFYSAKQAKKNAHPHLALLHSTGAFPFAVKPAHFMLNDFPLEAIGACSLLEDWKIPNRLASNAALAGCFEGAFKDLLLPWIKAEHQRQTTAPLNWQVVSFLGEADTHTLANLIKPYSWLSLQAIHFPDP